MITLTEKKIIAPKLRFPEFDGEWVEKKLGSISEIRTGPFGSLLHEKDYATEGTPIITVEHLGELGLIHKNMPLVTDEDKKRLKSYLLKENDIVFSRVGSVDRNSIVEKKEDGWLFSGRLLRIRTESNKINPKFLSYYFQLEYTKHRIRSAAVGQTMPSLNTEILKSFAVEYTSIPEQQKIASFLTAVDKRIHLLTQKKEKLKQYKKGVMQKLFSREFRFRNENGNEYPEWDEKRLGEIGTTYNGLVGKSKLDFGDGKPYIQYMQIFKKSNIDVTLCGFVKISQKENQNRIKYGDILFTTSSETPDEVGTSSVMLDNIEEVYLNSFCFGFRPHSLNELVPTFAQYLFRSKNLRKEIIKLAQGSTRYNMSKNEFLKLKTYLPTNPEQQKIASFLTAIDKRIQQVEHQIKFTNQWKMGLLQKMFV